MLESALGTFDPELPSPLSGFGQRGGYFLLGLCLVLLLVYIMYLVYRIFENDYKYIYIRDMSIIRTFNGLFPHPRRVEANSVISSHLDILWNL